MANFFKPQAKKTHINQAITVKVLRLDMNGDGVVKWQNKPLFVSGALPDETVQVKIIEEKAKYMRGKALKVINVSDDRVKPKCAHFYQCGGCDIQHMQQSTQLKYKQQKVADLFRRNAGLEKLLWHKPLTSSQWHYRRKARIGVQYNKLNESIVGFRLKNSNTLTNIKRCLILPEIFENEFARFKSLIDSFETLKAISHIEVINALLPRVIFRVVRSLTANDIAKIKMFSSKKDYQIVLQNEQNIKYLDGSKPHLLSYNVKECQLEFSESDFVQVNEQLNHAMITQAIDWLDLKKTDNVADLFCGLGNFSLPVAAKVNSLIGIEGVDDMVERAQGNARLNKLTNTSFYQADLNAENANWPWFVDNINKVIIDPARAGALNAVKNIVKTKASTLLYVSCDAATMARDSKVLLDNGFALIKLSIMDMFAQTKHIETMALFVKNK